ncbi:MAG TPA: prepilin-type N-terminal cleavage/methylation domain-containing protein [Gemmatimonadota bacterium]|nr:prepilin-type N-terminal cleavage/methylation domain-containing protein [Gemmatimonadota bacterium]
MRRLRSSRGFTLIEIVVAIVMLTFGVLASASLTAALMRSNRGVTNRTRAIETLRLKVEDLQSQNYSDIADGNDTATIGAITYNRAWTVTANSPAANLKTVTLTVTWGDRQGNHTITNQTIRAQ